MKDKELEELFLAQRPTFDDHDAFMARLSKRLDAVELVKRQQEATLRRYKIAMVAAFAIGIVSGAVSMVVLFSASVQVPLFTMPTQLGFLCWLGENSRLLAASALSLLMTAGIISIVGNVQDIMRMRVRLKQLG